jgi:hypothetical protein
VRRSFDSLRSLRISARGSDAAKTPQVSFAGSGEFDSHTLPPVPQEGEKILRLAPLAQDFGSRLRRRENASS